MAKKKKKTTATNAKAKTKPAKAKSSAKAKAKTGAKAKAKTKPKAKKATKPKKPKAIPDGFNSVSAYIIAENSKAAMEFYGKAFGAKSVVCMEGPGGSTMHAEVRIGNSTIMMSDENPQWGAKSAKAFGGSPISIDIYCDDVDTLFARAVDAGCKVLFPLGDQFWGDRMGKLEDPFGIQWGLATHIEDPSEAEVERRGQEFMAKMAETAAAPTS